MGVLECQSRSRGLQHPVSPDPSFLWCFPSLEVAVLLDLCPMVYILLISSLGLPDHRVICLLLLSWPLTECVIISSFSPFLFLFMFLSFLFFPDIVSFNNSQWPDLPKSTGWNNPFLICSDVIKFFCFTANLHKLLFNTELIFLFLVTDAIVLAFPRFNIYITLWRSRFLRGLKPLGLPSGAVVTHWCSCPPHTTSVLREYSINQVCT